MAASIGLLVTLVVNFGGTLFLAYRGGSMLAGALGNSPKMALSAGGQRRDYRTKSILR